MSKKYVARLTQEELNGLHELYLMTFEFCHRIHSLWRAATLGNKLSRQEIDELEKLYKQDDSA